MVFVQKWANNSKDTRATYNTWIDMRCRCRDENHPFWKYYGARGISVCERWNDYDLFIQDMGLRPVGLTLERINNDGNYEPGNCRWATQTEQARNRSGNRHITFGNKTQCLSEWAEETGINVKTLTKRLNKGWPLERVFAKAGEF